MLSPYMCQQKICSSNVTYQYTGGSHFSQIFWEHENLSSLSVLIYIKLYNEKEKSDFGKKIWAKQESSLTAVWLKCDPPVYDSCELSAINTMTRSTGIHTFHITAICPLSNLSATCIYISHCMSIKVYI